MTFFDDWYMTMFNAVLTAAPLFVRAIFDQDINYKIYDSKKKKLSNKPVLKVYSLFFIKSLEKLSSVVLRWTRKPNIQSQEFLEMVHAGGATKHSNFLHYLLRFPERYNHPRRI